VEGGERSGEGAKTEESPTPMERTLREEDDLAFSCKASSRFSSFSTDIRTLQGKNKTTQ
jgi:hypothetical protein